MTLRQKLGQMLMISFSGTSLSNQEAKLLRHFHPGGITIFGDNFASPSQLKALDGSIQRQGHIPLFISVDQEGGEVIRITRGVKQLPSESYYGQLNNAGRVYSDCSTEATQIRKLGINMNLAPVLDVASNPNSIMAQERRSFGPNANIDASLGTAEIRAYQHHGVAATAKHVLGLGVTSVNPETQLPTIRLSKAGLQNQLLPFRKAVSAHVDSIMVTHVLLPGITGAHTPASLSYKVVTGLLRDQLHFGGVLMTDSLTMGSVSGHFGIATASLMALQAGEDVLLIAGGPVTWATANDVENRIIQASKGHPHILGRVNASVTRILKLKKKLGLHLPTR